MIPSLLLADLRRRWPEQALVAGAVALVVAALVAQRAVTDSAESSVHALAHELGKNMLVLPAGVDPQAFHAHEYDAASSLPDDLRATIQSSPIARHVGSMELRLYGRAEANGVPAILVGDDGFGPEAAAQRPPPAVLGPAIARRLGVAEGAVVKIAGADVRVAQVADAAPDGLDEAIFVPLATAQLALRRPGEVNAARLAGCWCSIDVVALAGEVEKLLPGSRAITVAGLVKAQQGAVETMKRWSGTLLAAGAAIVLALVAGLVASQARRRAHEVGLLVAIGAPPERVTWMFVAQAALLGAAGALAGALAAVPATRWLAGRVLGLEVSPGLDLLGLAVAAAAAVSALAALVPAARAASKDPTLVLRELA